MSTAASAARAAPRSRPIWRRHPDVRERVALDIRQRNALRGQLEGKFAEPVPPRLWIANIRAARRTRWLRRRAAVAAGLLIFTVGAGTGWFAAHHETLAPPATVGVAQNAAAAYRTYVVEVAHPVEVASSAGSASAAMAVAPARQAIGRARPDAVRLQADGRPAAAGQRFAPRRS